jgi:NADH-ubiquinone oxidoreductase chain 4
MKVLIAYSSISHMAVCIIAVLANSEIGLLGGIMLGIAHGLVSPALFIAVGGILYDRYHQRLV